MNIENIDIKDLVLVGGGLFTVAIIAHGIWLAWRTRQEPLKLDISRELVPDDDEEDELARFRGELPNGGGRPVDPLQKDLDFESAVPVLLDPVETPAATAAPVAESARERAMGQAPAQAANASDSEPAPIRSDTSSQSPLPDTGPIIAQDPKPSRSGPRGDAAAPSETRAAPPDPGGEELLLINLMAPSGERFVGEALLAALRGQGLKYGEMNIFHRRDPETRQIQFSVANVLEPGTFDLAEISTFVSPGLVFFLQLPGPASPGDAIDSMLRITRSIAEELGAELKDENMTILTGQTVEHYRERVAEFSRRQLSVRV